MVIAIIAILASMLLPALSKARAAAQAIKCTGNEKQVGLYLALYYNDFDDYLPGAESPDYWTIPYSTPTGAGPTFLHIYAGTFSTGRPYEVLMCPNFRGSPQYQDGATFSAYGLNARIVSTPSLGTWSTAERVKLTRFNSPAATCIMGETLGYKDNGTVWPNTTILPPHLANGRADHDRKMNLIYLDGHAERSISDFLTEANDDPASASTAARWKLFWLGIE